MRDDVSCPDSDPNEPVTRGILTAELAKELARFAETTMSVEIARQLGAYEERRRIDRIQEYNALQESILHGVKVLFEQHNTQQRLDDHESRIVVLEARPAKRARKPATRKPRKPK